MGLIPDLPDAAFDAIVIGRAGMDLYPDPPGTGTHEARRFVSDLGGSAGNIAVALARHGAWVGLAAPVSDDPVGAFVAAELARFDVTHLTPEPVRGEARTSLALAETKSAGSRTVIYRNGAADFALAPLPPEVVQTARAVVVTGTALAAEPSRSSAMAALRGARFAILDLDYRPYSWPDPDAMRAVYAEAIAASDMIVGNDEEFALTGPQGTTVEDLSGSATILYKMGAKGARIVEGGTWSDLIPPFPVEALKPFGAGDAFLGGALAEMLRGEPLPKALRYGAAAAALVVARVGCASAMPDRSETEHFIASREG